MYCGVMLITGWKVLIMKTVLKLIDGCKDVWMHAMMLDDDAWMITRMDDVWNPRDADITKGKNNNLLTDFHANVLLPRE